MIARTPYLAFAIQDVTTAGLKEGERVDCTRCGLRKIVVTGTGPLADREAREYIGQWIVDHVCDEEAAATPWVVEPPQCG